MCTLLRNISVRFTKKYTTGVVSNVNFTRSYPGICGYEIMQIFSGCI